MDTFFIFILCVSLVIIGIIIGWVVRECKNQSSADGYLRCIFDEKDYTYYPILDLNTSMPEILDKPYAIFIIDNSSSQK